MEKRRDQVDVREISECCSNNLFGNLHPVCRNSASRELNNGHTPVKIGCVQRCISRTRSTSKTGCVITNCAPAATLRSSRCTCAWVKSASDDRLVFAFNGLPALLNPAFSV